MPLSAALRMPIFWLTAFGFGFFFYGIVGWAVHQVPFWESARLLARDGGPSLSP